MVVARAHQVISVLIEVSRAMYEKPWLDCDHYEGIIECDGDQDDAPVELVQTYSTAAAGRSKWVIRPCVNYSADVQGLSMVSAV